MSILKNVKLLYFVFLLSLLNVTWLVYYKKIKSIIIFASCCLVFYLINNNMIFVLGLSLVIVNIASLVNNKDKEGYENKKKTDDSESLDDEDADENNEDRADENNEDGVDENVKDKIETFDEGFEDDKLEKLKTLYKTKVNELDEDVDEESSFMQDKALMKKIKKFDPIIFNTIKNLNPVDIDKINKTINELTNKVKDP